MPLAMTADPQSVGGVVTDTLADVPNQPKPGTRNHAFRYPDDEWAALQAAAEENGETVTNVIHRALRGYVKRAEKKRGGEPYA
jgi:hypothetical protein